MILGGWTDHMTHPRRSAFAALSDRAQDLYAELIAEGYEVEVALRDAAYQHGYRYNRPAVTNLRKKKS